MMHEGWYHHWVSGVTLDDQLWHQALVIDCILELLHSSEQGSNNAMMWTLLRCGIVDTCYMWIPKESRCGWGRKVGGRKHVQLIAIDYHVATGTV